MKPSFFNPKSAVLSLATATGLFALVFTTSIPATKAQEAKPVADLSSIKDAGKAFSTLTYVAKTANGSTIKCDCATKSVNAIEGLWVGSYSADYHTNHVGFYSLSVYPDGSIVTRAKGEDGKFYYASGSWTLSEKGIFDARISSFVTPGGSKPIQQALSANYNATTGELSQCKWEDVYNQNGKPLKGPFEVKAVNGARANPAELICSEHLNAKDIVVK